RLGLLEVGDQLPTVREVIAQITINPNTVFKAYRELEREGLISSRPGQGTFVQRTLASTSLASHAALRHSLVRWLQSAYEAGLDAESVLALFMSTFQDTQKEETA
ncbi:MAG TPA: GntR family transcriptional regulator, partial [Ktedonobacterales bacterium]|nr:GntR family transcriptional regulator [Ktedonobacterales bacterium]